MIDRIAETELGNHELGDALGHVVGDDVGGDELFGLVRSPGIEQLNDRFDLLELDQVSVFHIRAHMVLSSPQLS